MPIKASRPKPRGDTEPYGHLTASPSLKMLQKNNNFYEFYHNEVDVSRHVLSDIPPRWLNRLLPATELTKDIHWQKVFGRIFFIDEHGVLSPLDMERVATSDMSNFKDLHGLPYNVAEILQQFTSQPLQRIHHYANNGEYLRALFDERKMVDVLIHVEDKIFAAHRVAVACHSVYFARALVLNQHQRHKLTEVKLKNVNPRAFYCVLRFFYTGTLYVNDNNVNDLVGVANQLQIPSVLFRCLDYLGYLSRDNLAVAQPANHMIRIQVQQILSMEMNELPDDESFLNMPIESVETALGDDDVKIDRELDVFYAALAWLAYELGSRRKYLDRLMRQVRFTCMSPAEVIEATQVNHLVRNSPYCRNRVLEAIWLMTIKGYETYDVLSCPCPRQRTRLLGRSPEPTKYGLGPRYSIVPYSSEDVTDAHVIAPEHTMYGDDLETKESSPRIQSTQTVVPGGRATSIQTLVPACVCASAQTLVPTGKAASNQSLVSGGQAASIQTLVPACACASAQTLVPGGKSASIQTLVPAGKAASIQTFVPGGRAASIQTLVSAGRGGSIQTLEPVGLDASIQTLVPAGRGVSIQTLVPAGRGASIQTLVPAGKAASIQTLVPAGEAASVQTLVPAGEATSKTLVPEGKTTSTQTLVPEGKTTSIQTLVPEGKTTSIQTLVPAGRGASIQTLVPAGRGASIQTLVPEGKTTSIQTLVPAGRAASIQTIGPPGRAISSQTVVPPVTSPPVQSAPASPRSRKSSREKSQVVSTLVHESHVRAPIPPGTLPSQRNVTLEKEAPQPAEEGPPPEKVPRRSNVDPTPKRVAKEVVVPQLSDDEVPYFKFYSSQFDTDHVEGRMSAVEVNFRPRHRLRTRHSLAQPSAGSSSSSSSSSECSCGCLSGEPGKAPPAALDPGSAGDILAIGGYVDDSCTGCSHAQRLRKGTSSWEQLSDMPETRINFAAAYLDGYLYVVGGYDPVEKQNLATRSTFWFDTESDRWKRSGRMRCPRAFHCLCSLNGLLYAIGGQNECEEILNTVEVFNPENNRWSTVAPMSVSRVGASAVDWQDTLVVAGGYGETPDPDDPCPVLLSAECFDPEKNRWTKRGNLRIPRAQACLVQADSTLYLLGGATRDMSTGSVVSVADVDRYDAQADSWTHLTDLKTPRHNAGATVLGRKIYVVGGISTDHNQVLRSVEVYDLEADSWDLTLPDLPLGAKSLACVVVACPGNSEMEGSMARQNKAAAHEKKDTSKERTTKSPRAAMTPSAKR